MHLILGLAIAPGQSERSLDRTSVFYQAVDEALEVGDLAGGHPRLPRIEHLARSIAGHLSERLGEIAGATDRWPVLA